jgi:ABC-2 type transport system ATP-binding protein
MVALELVDAVKRYGSRAALAGVSLRLAAGEALGLLGPNGAGKTTALRLLLGFARASAGGVSLFGRDPSDPAARRGVGYLPERLVLPERATVRGFLRLQAGLAGIDAAARDAEVDAALASVGIADRARERIGGLSKGLRQRLGFANALLGKPALLVLDEPTSGLDPLGIRDARGWILAARERGAALLVSSHGLSEVERTCDRIAILNEGKLAASGALSELAQPGESLEDVFVRAVRG